MPFGLWGPQVWRPHAVHPPCRVLLGACPSAQVFVQLSPPQGRPLVSSSLHPLASRTS